MAETETSENSDSKKIKWYSESLCLYEEAIKLNAEEEKELWPKCAYIECLI